MRSHSRHLIKCYTVNQTTQVHVLPYGSSQFQYGLRSSGTRDAGNTTRVSCFAHTTTHDCLELGRFVCSRIVFALPWCWQRRRCIPSRHVPPVSHHKERTQQQCGLLSSELMNGFEVTSCWCSYLKSHVCVCVVQFTQYTGIMPTWSMDTRNGQNALKTSLQRRAIVLALHVIKIVGTRKCVNAIGLKTEKNRVLTCWKIARAKPQYGCWMWMRSEHLAQSCVPTAPGKTKQTLIGGSEECTMWCEIPIILYLRAHREKLQPELLPIIKFEQTTSNKPRNLVSINEYENAYTGVRFWLRFERATFFFERE